MAHKLDKKWRSEDVKVPEHMDFSALLLSNRVLKGLRKAGFKKPSPIQVEAIPVGRFGKDMMIQAKSGTGKTLVFSILALEFFKPKLFIPQVLILVPTREIATQVCSVIKTIGSSFRKLTCNSFIGGLPVSDDQQRASTTQIIVGTPGRLRQLIQTNALPPNSIRLLIFDEVDELISSKSFKEDIEDIFTALPDEKQVIAASATCNPKVKKIIYRFLCAPNLVRLNAKHLSLLGMVHYAVIVPFCPMPIILYRTKLEVIEKILKTVKFAQCLLFCNGIQRVELLYKDVKRFGFSATYISSAKEQNDRLRAMEKLKRFKCKVLVTSDLTARGIDAENVDLVINFDLPRANEVYLHRVGRAGRYGSIGVAISLVDTQETRDMRRIEKEGSFKTFMLPDPIPQDLILYPPESKFLFDDEELQNEDDSQVEISNTIDHDALNDNDYKIKCDYLNGNNSEKFNECNDNNYNLEKEVNKKNIEMGICKTSVYTADNASENASSNVVDGVESHNSIKHALECEMKEDEDYQDVGVHLESTNIKFNHHTKCLIDKKLQNEHTNDDGIELDKNKKSDLLSDFGLKEVISNESVGKSYAYDINLEPDVFGDKRLEKQDIIKDDNKNDACSVLEKNDFETDDKNLNEANFDNVPHSSEKKDIEKFSKDGSIDNLLESSTLEKIVKNMKDDPKCTNENLVKSSGNLKDMIKVFLDRYENESNKTSIDSKMTVDSDSQLVKDSGKLITTNMITNLQLQKHDFLYETFKSFQENNDGCSDLSKIEKEDKGKSTEHNSNLDLVSEEAGAAKAILSEKSEFKNIYIFPEKSTFENTVMVNEEIITVHTKLAEASEFPSKDDYPEKPAFESTPQASDKIEHDATKTPVDDVCMPVFENELNVPLFPELSEETYSADSVSSDEESEVPKQRSVVDSKSHSSLGDSGSVSSSSDSSSVSSSSGSEDDSDSETDSLSSSGSKSSSYSLSSTAASSLNEDEENAYCHNFSRTGRQNPSLVSGSVRGQVANDQNYYKYFHDYKCFCCGVSAKERMPQKRRKPCSRIPSINASTHFRNIENIPHHCNCSLFDHRENSFDSRICQSRNRRLQNFSTGHVTHSYSPREHSRCHRSRNSSSSIARGRERGQNTVQYPTHQRSSRHHHTLSCFMPTEHRCHPNTPDYPCEQAQLCEIWYKTFYNQWLHIQNVIN